MVLAPPVFGISELFYCLRHVKFPRTQETSSRPREKRIQELPLFLDMVPQYPRLTVMLHLYDSRVPQGMMEEHKVSA